MASKLNPPNPSTEPAALPPAGLLVVTIDRLPAWMLAAYGATWVSTPALDSLAARGVVFDRMIATSPAPDHTLHDLVGQLFAATGGWPAAGVTDDPVVAAGMVVATAGGPAASVRLVEAAAKTEVEENDAETNIARLVDAAIDVIAARQHRLVWCHIGSLAVAWDAPERYRDRYIDPEDPPPPSGARVPGFAVDADTDPDRVVGMRQVFAGQVTLLDSQLGRLFAAVREGRAAAAGQWSVLVVGIRGLPLGLHGWVGIGGPELPYGELVHVPAIFADAAGRMAAQRYGGLVVPADLGATLVDLVTPATTVSTQASAADLTRDPALDPTAPWRGVSLDSLFEHWSAAFRDRVIVTGADATAIVTPEWHGVLVADGVGGAGRADAFTLFAKPDDYFEQANVADRCQDAAERMAVLARQALDGDFLGPWLAELTPDGGVPGA